MNRKSHVNESSDDLQDAHGSTVNHRRDPAVEAGFLAVVIAGAIILAGLTLFSQAVLSLGINSH